MPSVLRSILSVIAGYIVMMVVVIALTLILVKTMGLKSGNPTPGYLAINVIYSLLAAAIGGFVTAAIARVKPIQHAAALAVFMAIMGVLSYRHYIGMQPLWYQRMMMFLPSLAAIGGAALQSRNAPTMPARR